jgi:NAD(P)-dependent dehydrogenase (short-subunit alcohol dehydrogenase family)
MNEMSGMSTLVVGASRGLGRGIAIAFRAAGADVVAVARRAAPLAELAAAHRGISTEVADAVEEDTASRLIDRYRPQVLVLVAGAGPVMGDLQHLTWETFSANWHSDVRIAFTWLRAALAAPLAPGSRIVLFSSGAALNGSPLSGGYAGAKATARFIAQYSQQLSDTDGLKITITTVMPRMTPHGEVGRAGIRAYAQAGGRSEDEFTRDLGPLITPQIAGAAMVDLVRSDPATLAPAYLLTGSGCSPLR